MISVPQRRRLLAVAERHLGVRYDRVDANGPWRDLSVMPAFLDCSSFVWRVAMEVMRFERARLAPDAGWLIDNLIEIGAPQIGDLVGYGRVERNHAVWHVMMYAGNATVIGACEFAGKVVRRPIGYEASEWKFAGIPPAPFRALVLR